VYIRQPEAVLASDERFFWLYLFDRGEVIDLSGSAK
jgi:hypothetical protein